MAILSGRAEKRDGFLWVEVTTGSSGKNCCVLEMGLLTASACGRRIGICAFAIERSFGLTCRQLLRRK